MVSDAQEGLTMFTKIIAGVDGCDGGRDAAVLAAAIAAASGAQLTLATVYPHDNIRTRASNAGFEQDLREDAEQLVVRARSEASVDADADVAAIGDLSPARGLQRLAENEQANLLVVGSSSHGTLGRVLLGDDARGTLRAAPCAVAVAPHGYAAAAHEIGTVGVGFDGSPESRAALVLASEIAHETSGRLEVLSVVKDAYPWGPVYAYAYVYPELEADRCRQAQKALDTVLAPLDVPAHGSVLTGSPTLLLDDLTKQVDLLVLGSRGFGPVRRVVMGSTSDHVIHHASCPVLVLPRGDRTEEASPGSESLASATA